MKLDDVLNSARGTFTVKRVYGEPYEKDGLTVIPAAAVRGGAGGGTGQGVGKVVHAVSRRSMGRLVLRPLCRNEVAILVCPPRRSTLIAVLRRVAMTCGPLPVRSW